MREPLSLTSLCAVPGLSRALSGRAATLLLALAAGLLLLLPAVPAGAQTSGSLPDITLSMSVISLTERDGPTDVTVTAVLRKPSPESTTVVLALGVSPLLTPSVTRGAVPGRDYSTTFERHAITIAAGSLTGATTFSINPTYDTRAEGDEAIVLTGTTAAGDVVAPTDLIIEDGPYLSFPRYIYGSLSYPDQPVSVTVEEAVHSAVAGGMVTYALTHTEPRDNPLGLTFDPATRQLTGTAPAADDIPDAGLITRYTITARDSAGHRATTLVSVAVVRDVCGPTRAVWFHASDDPPPGLVEDCNVLLAARDTLNGEAGALNWATDTPIDSWDGLTEFHTDWKQIRRIEVHGHSLNGAIPPILGHLGAPSSLDLVLGDDYRTSPDDRRNTLTGPIPPELGLPPNLIVLALSRNNLTGPIPRELANNGKLSSLYLHETGVQGPIPPEFGDLPMRNLSISGNRGVTGHIPWQLGKNVTAGDHPGLQVLNLYGNSLRGNIPWQLGRFGKLQHLALSDNRLTGGIPWQLGNLGSEEATLQRRVVEVRLNTNQLTGAIPPQLGEISNLKVLSLSENLLTGPIPPELGSLAKLQYLYLRDNRLSGSIPEELGHLGTLLEFHAYNNRLGGEIPSELGSLAALQQLHLACNDLSGAVPASIGAITTLTGLALQGNPQLDLSPAGLPDSVQRAGRTVLLDGPCPPQYEPPPASYRVEVTVWRSVRFPERYYVSTRPEGQSWTTHGTVIDLSALSESGRFHRGSPVAVPIELAGLGPLTIEVTVWRSVRFPDRYYVSTRPDGQGWTTHGTVVDLSALSESGRFHRGSPVAVEVELRLDP